MTEIQWLVSIMSEFKLPKPVQAKFIARIGEVETRISSNKAVEEISRAFSHPTNTITVSSRAPQQIDTLTMGKFTGEQVDVPPPVARKIVPQEVVTGSGNGTTIRGPRKF